MTNFIISFFFFKHPWWELGQMAIAFRISVSLEFEAELLSVLNDAD